MYLKNRLVETFSNHKRIKMKIPMSNLYRIIKTYHAKQHKNTITKYFPQQK